MLKRYRVKSKSKPDKSYVMEDDGRSIDHLENDDCEARLHHPFKDCRHIKKVKMHLGIEFDPEKCDYDPNYRGGTETHHLIRRSRRPDLINDKENKIRLSPKWHRIATDHKWFEVRLQKLFLTEEYLNKVNYKIYDKSE